MTTTTGAAQRRRGHSAGVHPQKRRTRHWAQAPWYVPLLFAGGGLAVVLVMTVFPFFNTVVLAFTDATMLRDGQFVGLDNFRRLLEDSRFLTALLNSTLYVIVVVPLMVVLPLILATLVAGKGRLLGFFRTAYYLPVVMSAAVDGAGVVRSFTSVTMPGVRNTMALIAMFSSVAAFRVFGEVYVLTGGTGGPGGGVVTMTMLIQREGTGLQAQTGYAGAISLVMFVILAVLLALQLVVQNRQGRNQ